MKRPETIGEAVRWLRKKAALCAKEAEQAKYLKTKQRNEGKRLAYETAAQILNRFNK